MAEPKLDDISIHLMARHYLSYLHTHCTKENELELLTVVSFINELITKDELGEQQSE